MKMREKRRDVYIAYQILEAIRRRQIATVRQVIKDTGLSSRTVVDYVRWLEEKGWIISQLVGRSKLMMLTDEGEAILEKLAEIITQFRGR
ncbi:MAG: MarR family transcriptional regulator [Thermoprotei archaeon]|nr:MAG: MarR family transcriptional regulator [Thermoprotei archaeon]